MTINDGIRNNGGSVEKCKGCANKISHISAARCSLLQIWYHINAKAYQVLYKYKIISN